MPSFLMSVRTPERLLRLRIWKISGRPRSSSRPSRLMASGVRRARKPRRRPRPGSDTLRSRDSPAVAGKVRVVHNGVDLVRFAPRPAAPELRAALGLPAGAPVVVSVGRFVAFKGYGHLLDAAALLEARRPGEIGRA